LSKNAVFWLKICHSEHDSLVLILHWRSVDVGGCKPQNVSQLHFETRPFEKERGWLTKTRMSPAFIFKQGWLWVANFFETEGRLKERARDSRTETFTK